MKMEEMGLNMMGKSLVFLLLDPGNCLLIFKNTFCCYCQDGTKTGFHQRIVLRDLSLE